MSQSGIIGTGGGGGGGTVTSITAGTGITLTPNPITTTGTIGLTIPVTIADGGTNATSMTNTDGVVYFDGTRLVTTAVGTATFVLTSNGAGLAPTFQAASGGGGITTIDLDTGSVTGSTITFSPNNSSTAGTVTTVANGATLIELDFSDSVDNTIIGSFTSAGTLTGGQNSGLGNGVFGSLSNGADNCSVGYDGQGSLQSGLQNNSIGAQALLSLVSGNYNQAIGFQAGNGYIGGESSNICIGDEVLGTAGESNTLRIGAGTGTSEGQLSQSFISGINGFTGSSGTMMVTIDDTDQLGVLALPAITINGDTGSVTGSTITFNAASQAGSTVNFSGSGTTMSLNVTDSGNNTMIGLGAGPTASGVHNAGFSARSFALLTTGNGNVAIGYNSLSAILGGSNCTAIGSNAGTAYSGSESSNICIGAAVGGDAGVSHQLRIGSGTGTGVGNLNESFICGIKGITVTGAAVLVSSTDQLGVAVSSRRFKDNIADMPSMTESLMALQPVTFTYKVGSDQSMQYGLIAEQVQEVMPQLVILDNDGLPQTVKYHDLPTILLSEIQKLRKELDELKKEVSTPKRRK